MGNSETLILICRNGSVEVRCHSIKLPEVELHGGRNGEEDPQTGCHQVAEFLAHRLFEVARSISTVGCSSSASSMMELSVCGSGAKPLSSSRKRTWTLTVTLPVAGFKTIHPSVLPGWPTKMPI
eukprot:jgi/Tetstr1/449384/TSEL_003893.t1